MPTPLPRPDELAETPPPVAAPGPAPAAPRADAALAARAVRERWPIPEDRRREIADRLSRIAADPDKSDRTAIAAAKVLRDLDGLNLDAEKHAAGDTLNVNVTGASTEQAAAELAQWRARQQDQIKAFLAGPPPPPPPPTSTPPSS
jgi:hypothetical protein